MAPRFVRDRLDRHEPAVLPRHRPGRGDVPPRLGSFLALGTDNAEVSDLDGPAPAGCVRDAARGALAARRSGLVDLEAPGERATVAMGMRALSRLELPQKSPGGRPSRTARG